MAKIVIAGDAVVVTSSMKLEDIKNIQKYRPDALLLKDEDGEPVFKLGVSRDGSCGSLGKYGAEFANAARDGSGLAIMTLSAAGAPEDQDITEFVADTIGANVAQLNKLEATLPDVLSEIAAEREEIKASITVAQ
ncbi:MAG: hypothetical protein LUD69_05815 [Oscillospiraceae bacterium]|nr:hypothetical protein [Oscillospiraceae bacterium]